MPCSAYSHLTQQFSQTEIAWGHVVLAARLLGYGQHLFREDGRGHWISQGLSFTNGELERAPLPTGHADACSP